MIKNKERRYECLFNKDLIAVLFFFHKSFIKTIGFLFNNINLMIN